MGASAAGSCPVSCLLVPCRRHSSEALKHLAHLRSTSTATGCLPALAGHRESGACQRRRAGMQGGWLAERSVLSLPIWSPPSAADFCFSAVTVWAWCHRKHGRGRSLFGTMPRRRRLDIWLWSAPFPGALLSNSLALLGTFRLLHWCHLLQVPPQSCGFSSWSAGTTAAPEEVWASLAAFAAPARASTCGWVPLSSCPCYSSPSRYFRQ